MQKSKPLKLQSHRAKNAKPNPGTKIMQKLSLNFTNMETLHLRRNNNRGKINCKAKNEDRIVSFASIAP